MMDIKDYSIDEHIHRFAVWTAARAASRGRLKNTEVEFLIDNSRLREKVAEIRQDNSLNDISYRNWLKENCEVMCNLVKQQNWGDYKSDYFCTGLSAKIISTYIKTVEVIPTRGLSLLSEVAYPPIDSILLKNLNKKHDLKLKTNWSKFDWLDYEQKLDMLNLYYPGTPKWKIEVDWKVSNEDDPLIPEALLETV